MYRAPRTAIFTRGWQAGKIVQTLYNAGMPNPLDPEFPPTHGLFPIRYVCAETGLKPVTLRAWERRYGLIRPVRTPKGHRLYSSADLVMIHKIRTLLEEGVAVSQVARLLSATSPAESPTRAAPTGKAPTIVDLPAQTSTLLPVADPITTALLEATREFNPMRIDRIYGRLVMRRGWEGVHRQAFLQVYTTLVQESEHTAEAEVRLAIFVAWATAILSDQLRHALLLCEGSACPCLIVGGGQDRLSGLLLFLACARQGLRVLPLWESPSPRALQELVQRLRAPALLLHCPRSAASDRQWLKPLQRCHWTVPVYVSGVACPASRGESPSRPGAQPPSAPGSGVATLPPLELPVGWSVLPETPLEAADQLTRRILQTLNPPY
jgi:DNA-binding transcriptional MerR regulator